jgi:hypothetical protein
MRHQSVVPRTSAASFLSTRRHLPLRLCPKGWSYGVVAGLATRVALTFLG